MTPHLAILAILVSLTLTVVACDRAPEIAGISGNAMVPELSDEQAEQYCDHFDRRLRQVETDQAVQQGICMMFAVPVAQQMSDDHNERVVACRASRDECLTEIGDELAGMSEESAHICVVRDRRQDCDVSLHQLDTCMDAALKHLLGGIHELADLGCPGLVGDDGIARIDAAFDTFEQFGQSLPQIEECQIVRQKCPAL